MAKPAGRKGFERHPEGIRFGVLDRLTGYALRRAQLALYADFDAALAATGVTPQSFAALVLVGANPGLSQSRLAEVMGVARSRIVALVDALETRGWVRRAAVAGDRRAHGLLPTAAGLQAEAALAAQVVAHDARVTRALSPAERAQLRALLDRIG